MAKMPDGWIFIPKEKSRTEIELVPSELVFCHNCKYSAMLYADDRFMDGYCQRHNIAVSETFYCADGKPRKDEEDA